MVIVLIIFMLVSSRKVVSTEELERFTIELGENILTSRLADGRAVFSSSELDMYDNTKAEPYFRHCNYAYFLEIEAMEAEQLCGKNADCESFCSSVCGVSPEQIKTGPAGNCACGEEATCICKKKEDYAYAWLDKHKWSFGYKPGVGLGSGALAHTASFDVAASVDGKILPAKMRLTVYENWLTRTTCLVQKAFTEKTVQTMEMPCIKPEGLSEECVFPLRKNNEENTLCIFRPESIADEKAEFMDNCRQLGIDVEPFYHPYSGKEKITLKAIPIQWIYMDAVENRLNEAQGSATPEQLKGIMADVCREAEIYKVTDPATQAIGTVLLCLGDA